MPQRALQRAAHPHPILWRETVARGVLLSWLVRSRSSRRRCTAIATTMWKRNSPAITKSLNRTQQSSRAPAPPRCGRIGRSAAVGTAIMEPEMLGTRRTKRDGGLHWDSGTVISARRCANESRERKREERYGLVAPRASRAWLL